jgi:hypothetical protein
MPDKNWWFLTKPDQPHPILLNLDRVQTVEIISEQSLRLRFSDTMTVKVEGQQALGIVKYLMSKAIQVEQNNKSQGTA